MVRSSSAPGTEAATQLPYKRVCTFESSAQTGYTMTVGPDPSQSCTRTIPCSCEMQANCCSTRTRRGL